jgi:hypothetical protein
LNEFAAGGSSSPAFSFAKTLVVDLSDRPNLGDLIREAPVGGKDDSEFRWRIEEIMVESWRGHEGEEVTNACLDILADVRPGLLRRLGANWRGIAAGELPWGGGINKSDAQRLSPPCERNRPQILQSGTSKRSRCFLSLWPM